jgi:hypothetical protein
VLVSVIEEGVLANPQSPPSSWSEEPPLVIVTPVHSSGSGRSVSFSSSPTPESTDRILENQKRELGVLEEFFDRRIVEGKHYNLTF